MTEKNTQQAKLYYETMSQKNYDDIAQYLHPEVTFVAPLAQTKGKEAMLKSLKEFMQFFKKLTIRSVIGSNNEAVVIYNLECPEPFGLISTASHLTFKDGLIFSIELFYDARPFTNN